MKISEVLRKALAHLTEYGWYQGDFFKNVSVALFDSRDDLKCPAFAMGAVYAVAGEVHEDTDEEGGFLGYCLGPTHEYGEGIRYLTDALYPLPLVGLTYGVAGFNDKEGRTFEDIQALFHRAINKAEADEASLELEVTIIPE